MNKVFFPQDALDILVALERVDVEGEELVLTQEGFRYSVQEAVRILEEVTTGEDPRGLIGRVSETETLVESHAAEILGNSMIIEDSAYDIVPGLLASPAGDAPDGTDETSALSQLSEIEELREALG